MEQRYEENICHDKQIKGIKKRTIPINTAITDSFRLKIKFDDCKILDSRLTSETEIVYLETGEITDNKNPPKPLIIEKDGIKVRIFLTTQPLWNSVKKENITTKYINLTISSKLLKERYFEGIHKNNLKYFYNCFIDYGIFECSFNTFLDSGMSDTDVCINRYSHNKNIFIDALKSLFQQSDTKQKYLNPFFTDPNNLGLEFYKRDKAKPSLPYLKFYHKELELLNKKEGDTVGVFYNTFLKDYYSEDIKELTRVEATIKNYKHKLRLKKYGILPAFKTLREYFEISQKDLYNFVVFSLNAYIITKPRVKAPNLSPSDHLLYESIQNNIIKGYDYKSLLSLVETFKGSSPKATKNAKSRMRKKIAYLYDLLIHKDLKIQAKSNHNFHVLEYLRFLNIRG